MVLERWKIRGAPGRVAVGQGQRIGRASDCAVLIEGGARAASSRVSRARGGERARGRCERPEGRRVRTGGRPVRVRVVTCASKVVACSSKVVACASRVVACASEAVACANAALPHAREAPSCAPRGRTLEGAQAAIGCAVDAIAPWGDAITLEVAAIHLKVDGIGSEEVALLLGEAA
jgi:hypothetical protein